MLPTTGTKLSVWANFASALVGAFMTVDYTTVINNPKTSGAIVTGLGFVNMLLHMFTGNAPIVGAATK